MLDNIAEKWPRALLVNALSTQADIATAWSIKENPYQRCFQETNNISVTVRVQNGHPLPLHMPIQPRNQCAAIAPQGFW